MRTLAEGLEEHHISRARMAGWLWAEIGALLEVSALATHKGTPRGCESATAELGRRNQSRRYAWVGATSSMRVRYQSHSFPRHSSTAPKAGTS
jgi:hypothetical protein